MNNQNNYPGFNDNSTSHSSWIFIVIYILLFLSISVAIYFAIKKIKQNETITNVQSKQQEQVVGVTDTSPKSSFPFDDGSNANGQDYFSATSSIKAENLAFGHFYKKVDDNFRPNPQTYSLPINVKVDVANYHDVARKINLDSHIDSLNANGFAILDNQFSSEADNFFDLYRYILRKDVPIVITGDFLLYYYQNNLKQVYKDIEHNAFYETLWDINKAFYDIALVRYKQKREESVSGNDPVLEGARLELAYFATALKLLMPSEGQISKEANLNDLTKFNEQEVEKFYFTMPVYLSDDVDREVSLIKSAKGELKSPVMLFKRDYGYFSIPEDYRQSAKLNNFYLATRWMNNVFPLYYRNANCPDCLLDYNDWNINLIAASFITKDFYDNQQIKNQWATVYKFISFFSGLRHELTYLHYQSVFSDLFGENYDVDKIFSRNNPNRESDINKIQEALAKYSFAGIEGGFVRTNPTDKAKLGMRILQEPYWPNDYIFTKLTGEDMPLLGENKDVPTISPKNVNFKYRDRGLAMDILNIVEGVEYPNQYFRENTNYGLYGQKIDALRLEIADFTPFTWNDNIYWSTLDITKKLFDYQIQDVPAFMRTSTWKSESAYNSFLSAWTNLHLPGDAWGNYNESRDEGFSSDNEICNDRNYVEPNIALIRELIARNEMLGNMLFALNVTKKANVAEVRLRDVNKRLEGLLEISKKELTGEALDYDDCKFLNNFVKLHVVERLGGKIMPASENLLQERLDGVRMISLIYEKGNEKVMVFGPVFKHQEKMTNVR